jgi:chromosome segregation ATPase
MFIPHDRPMAVSGTPAKKAPGSPANPKDRITQILQSYKEQNATLSRDLDAARRTNADLSAALSVSAHDLRDSQAANELLREELTALQSAPAKSGIGLSALLKEKDVEIASLKSQFHAAPSEDEISRLRLALSESQQLNAKLQSENSELRQMLNEAEANLSRQLGDARSAARQLKIEADNLKSATPGDASAAFTAELDRANANIRDLKAEVEKLRAEKASVNDFAELAAELDEVNDENVELRRQLQISTANETRLKRRVIELERERDDQVDAIEQLESDTMEMRKELEDKIRALEQAERTQAPSVSTTELEKLRDENAGLARQLKAAQEELRAKESESADVGWGDGDSTRVVELQDEIAALKRTVSDEQAAAAEASNQLLGEVERLREEVALQKQTISSLMATAGELRAYSAWKEATVSEYSTRIDQLETEKAALESPAKEAAILKEETTGQKKTIDNLSAQLGELSSQVEQLTNELKSVSTDRASLEEQIVDREKRISDYCAEIDQLRSENSQLRAASADSAAAKEEIRALERRLEASSFALDQVVAEEDQLQTSLTALKEKLADSEGTITDYSGQLDRLRAEIESLKQANSAGSAASQSQILALQQRLAEFSERVDQLTADNNAFKRLAEDSAALNSQIATLKEENSDQKERIDRLSSENQTLKAELEAKQWLSNQIDDLTAANLDLSKQLDGLRSMPAAAKAAPDEEEDEEDVPNAKDFESRLRQLQSELEVQNSSILELRQSLSLSRAESEAAKGEIGALRREIADQSGAFARLRREYQKAIDDLRRAQELQDEMEASRPEQPQKDAGKGDADELMLNYVRVSLLQFFAKDNRSRGQMIPILLGFLNCTQEQIRNAQQSWDHSQSFFPSMAGCHVPSLL